MIRLVFFSTSAEHTPPSWRTANNRGSSLIEILVSTTLMGIALAGIATMSVTTIKADTQSRLASAATTLAQAKLEELRLLGRSHPDWADGSDHQETNLNENGEVSADDGFYTRQWTVERDYNGFRRLARVTVTVLWLEDEERSVSLSSLF